MDIDYNQYANEFEITLTASEFAALREFMKLAAVVALWPAPFTTSQCNILDPGIAKQGTAVAKVLSEFYTIGRADNDDDHDQLISK